MTQFQSTPPAPPLPNEPPGPGGTPPVPDPPLPAPDVDLTGSDPNAGGAAGLAGGMGVSSERVPLDADSIEGTGSHGTATTRANGTWASLRGGGGNDTDQPEDDEHS